MVQVLVLTTFWLVFAATFFSGIGWIEAGEDTPGFTFRSRGVRVRVPDGDGGYVYSNINLQDDVGGFVKGTLKHPSGSFEGFFRRNS